MCKECGTLCVVVLTINNTFKFRQDSLSAIHQQRKTRETCTLRQVSHAYTKAGQTEAETSSPPASYRVQQDNKIAQGCRTFPPSARTTTTTGTVHTSSISTRENINILSTFAHASRKHWWCFRYPLPPMLSTNGENNFTRRLGRTLVDNHTVYLELCWCLALHHVIRLEIAKDIPEPRGSHLSHQWVGTGNGTDLHLQRGQEGPAGREKRSESEILCPRTGA